MTPGRSQLPGVLWTLCAAFIVYGTTIPFSFTSDSTEWLRHLREVSVYPLTSADAVSRWSISDFAGNVLLFLPFGVFGMWTTRHGTIAARVAFVTGLGCLLSAGAEVLQLTTVDRTSSVADLIANITGTFAGAVGAALTSSSSTAYLRSAAATGLTTAPSFFPLVVAAALLCFGAWAPFDVTMDIGSLLPKLRSLLRDPWDGDPARGDVLALMQHLLFASILVVWLKDIGVRGAVRAAAIAGTVVPIVLEASQWFIAPRMPGVSDALVGVAGSLGGAAVGTSFPPPRPRTVWVAGLFLLTMIGVAVQQLGPFEPAPEPRPFQWVPFLNYYVLTTGETVMHSAELLLTYFPIGFVIGMAVERRPQRLAATAVAALAIAGPVEYFQQFIVGRHPDVTDVAVALAAAWLGSWTATAGWRRFREDLALYTAN